MSLHGYVLGPEERFGFAVAVMGPLSKSSVKLQKSVRGERMQIWNCVGFRTDLYQLPGT